MRYGLICLFFALIACFAGCKASKRVANAESVQREVENVATAVDKSHSSEAKGENVRVETQETTWEYSRTTAYGDSGNVRAVQETWRGTGRTGLAVRNDSSRAVSVTDIATTDSSYVKVDSTAQSSSDFKSDGRPVQGIEWLWVVIGGILVLFVIAYFAAQKFIKK